MRESALFLEIGSALDELYAVDELRREVKLTLQLIRVVVGDATCE